MDTNLKKPKISVVMACYNGEKYIKDALESILNQTFVDFELIIINDGSTDNSLHIIQSYNDPRIKLIDNEKNMGHTFCLNVGIRVAQGEYIARMDSDDISLPSRFQKQVEFMDNHQDIAVSGTWTKIIGEGSGYINRFFTKPDDIKANLLFYASLAHPTVMIRKSVLDKHNLQYGIDIDRDENCEDYSLWSKLSKHEKLANIPKILLLYRLHKENVTNIYSDKNKKSSSFIRLQQLKELGLSPTPEDMTIHNSIRSNLNDLEKWLTKIIDANKISHVHREKSLQKIIYLRWHEACSFHCKEGLITYTKFKNSILYKTCTENKTLDTLKILIKSLLKR